MVMYAMCKWQSRRICTGRLRNFLESMNFLANIGEAVQNSRQAAMSGDYATANVFYSAACEQIVA